MSRGLPRWLAGVVVAALALLVVVVGAGFLDGEEPAPVGSGGPEVEAGRSGLPVCSLDDLPPTTLEVVDDIETGGPFEHPRHDGGRFGNYEGLLPPEELGYYREYTVETPGLDHRGARRIVTGGEMAVDPEVWFFTDDHYESFCEFDPAG